MRPAQLLFLLFLAVPLVEIYVLIEVGGIIGAIPTVFLVVFTAVLGAMLLQAQGLSTLRRVQDITARGGVPAVEMLEGLFLLVGGALLLTPGFFTDAVGFACLVTPLRRWVITRWLKRQLAMHGQGPGGQQGPGAPPQGPKTLDGEYWREDD